ncbi:hypothetical protein METBISCDRAFT_29544 [Metschnikowia bicuspidata]|uniref:Carboxypeptidase n=1 Tax=Metschnikowia bicuspidata TaxID=27322 RepID=A0A4P9ZI73_9ASCO|nr:hypothetical protein METBISCDRAFT_29544 [Metschnikowia bicuspidata]
MKASIAVVVAAMAVSANALHLPSFKYAQKVLSYGYDAIGQSYNQAAQTLEAMSSDLVQLLASTLGEDVPLITSEERSLWSEMLLKFPTQMALMRIKSSPLKPVQEEVLFDFHVTDAKLPDHALRVKSTLEDLGIDTVKQYTGYLDVVEEDKHFFYWFFESRNDPKNDPVILWLNGGPGCSSLTGLFFELGPSSIGEDLKPVFNPHAWNKNASVIFLDQPVNVGFSYSSKSVTNTVAAGKDVYAFLELFFKQFPEYKNVDFHIAGESYGGHYIPAFALEILSHKDRLFDLKSVLIGNGLTDPLIQYEHFVPMACGKGGEPSVLSAQECANMASSIPRCLFMIETCYNTGSVWSCVPASIYCNNAQMGPYQKTGRNVYDIRKRCGNSSLCYDTLQYIEDYLNLPEVRKKLGVEVDLYQSCNFDVNKNFLFAGDWMKPYHKNVVDMLESGLPVLVYAGDKDFICNWLGNQAWTEALPWSGHKNFSAAPLRDWKVGNRVAGKVKNHKHFTFLRVFEAGHMVPYDQPENSLAMVNSWIAGDYAYA